MRFDQPRSAAEFAARDALLQASLRDEAGAAPIREEYPLVLSPEAASFSVCAFEGERVVAHANLWPRQAGALRVGLVGNVATEPELRGRGLMRAMFEEVKERARAAELDGLVLWSDLEEFYQKLGFRSCGTERRYLYESPLPRQQKRGALAKIQGARLGDHELQALLQQRHATGLTLSRSPAEMRTQLTIPHTHLYRIASGFLVEGRGGDLRGVVHEWGAPSPQALLDAVSTLMTTAGHATLMVLAPGDLAADWHAALAEPAVHVEEHAMALSCALTANAAPALERLFVWGLDSI